MVKLIVTDSLFLTFECLNAQLRSLKDLNQTNVVFTEEKISLMTERFICSVDGGSFNTSVYSFGKYLSRSKTFDKILSKEGSAMAVKRVLSTAPVKRINRGSIRLAPKLSELIAQLKSAGVYPQNIENCLEQTKGLLKEKLGDIACVYKEYEKFIVDNGLEDQNSSLTYLPSLIRESEEIKGANVFIVGLSSITVQMRKVIEALLDSAKNVTAILVGGQNKFAFVNETADIFRDIVARKSLSLIEEKVASPYEIEGKIIVDGLFNPLKFPKQKIQTDKITLGAFTNVYQEVERVAQVIKSKVISGKARFRDFVIALSDTESYKDVLYQTFDRLEIPYYLDQTKATASHPLVQLIGAYIDAFRKNFDRESVKQIYKNPLFSQDKNLTDDFDNYTLKYNINYNKIFNEFTLSDGEDLQPLEAFRISISSVLKEFNIFKLLDQLNVEKKLEEYSISLKEMGYIEEGAVSAQIYQAVISVLQEMSMLLGGEKISLWEYKSIFFSGVEQLKLSLIPQYSDAVFVGDFHECALVKAKNLFVIGLTSEVPNVKEDVAILNDSEITTLSQVKVLVEPKIRVVNHRMRESVALSLSAFSEHLYLSYPTTKRDGGKAIKSEIVNFINSAFTVKSFPDEDGYLTHKQGLYSFSKECGEFAVGKSLDFTRAASFYHVDNSGKSKDIAKRTNKEIKIKLAENQNSLISGITSPTGIEEFYTCPYKAFLTHGLKIKEREESKVEGAFVGTLMHDILKDYVCNIQRVTDKISSDRLFYQVAENILQDVKYRSLKSDAQTSFSLERALEECKEYCYKTYQSLKNSQFICDKDNVEVGFGKSKNGKKSKYPAIELLDGKVKISGVIDRIDTCGEYFRILDYKTGGYDASSSKLFNGTKLQLFLYSAAVKDLKLAGAYYLPISNSFQNSDRKLNVLADGKMLDDEKVINMQDTTFSQRGESEYFAVTKDNKQQLKGTIKQDTLQDMVKYSLVLSEQAARQMQEGVIVPSPAKTGNEEPCDYCPFYAMCYLDKQKSRKVKKVKDTIFSQALNGEGQE